MSPFIPSPSTPYKDKKSPSVDFVLRVIAITRIELKNVHIPTTTALGVLDEYGKEKALRVGANVIMPNFTPLPYRENYQIYPKNKIIADYSEDYIVSLSVMIESIGRTISKSKGDSLKRQLVQKAELN